MNNKKRQIAVFGGSFNPPNNSHFEIAKHIANEYKEIEKIIFVPVSVKYNKENLAPNEIRYNMLKSICNKFANFEVSRIEIDEPRQLYTIETLEKIENQNKNCEIYFILGTDNLKQLETWHDAENLLKKYKFIVLGRNYDIIDEIIKNNAFLSQNTNSFIKCKNFEKIDLSSTIVREKLQKGEDVSDLLPKEILEIVKGENLWQKNQWKK